MTLPTIDQGVKVVKKVSYTGTKTTVTVTLTADDGTVSTQTMPTYSTGKDIAATYRSAYNRAWENLHALITTEVGGTK